MLSSLDELLIESIRPRGLSSEKYVVDLKRPAGPLEKVTLAAANSQLHRIVNSWPDKDSPLSRCRIICLFRHFKNSLPLSNESLGDAMLRTAEATISAKIEYIVNLHEMGFACFTFAYDLYDQTLKAFWDEKRTELDAEYKQEVFEIYLLAVYHLSRSRLPASKHREMILFGVHDSYNALYRRLHGFPAVAPQSLITSYQSVIERWIKSASDKRQQSPSYALVRTVFHMLGMTSPMARMICAGILEASANHLLELNESFNHRRVSAGL